MQYTARQEKDFWELDSESTDISDILEVLNANFRTFGEGLHAVMEKKAGHPISDPKQYLKERCQTANIDIKKIASDNTLKNWFEGGLRPKKGEDSRYKMFAIAYALGLNVEETIPHLISYAEGWLEYSKKQSDFEPKDFIPLFTFIADTAEEAKLESVRRNDHPDFSKVAEEYRNKVDNILDVQFIIKPPKST